MSELGADAGARGNDETTAVVEAGEGDEEATGPVLQAKAATASTAGRYEAVLFMCLSDTCAVAEEAEDAAVSGFCSSSARPKDNQIVPAGRQR